MLVVPVDAERVLAEGGIATGMRDDHRFQRTVQIDLVVAAGGGQGAAVGIAGVHPVLARQQIPPGKFRES